MGMDWRRLLLLGGAAAVAARARGLGDRRRLLLWLRCAAAVLVRELRRRLVVGLEAARRAMLVLVDMGVDRRARRRSVLVGPVRVVLR